MGSAEWLGSEGRCGGQEHGGRCWLSCEPQVTGAKGCGALPTPVSLPPGPTSTPSPGLSTPASWLPASLASRGHKWEAGKALLEEDQSLGANWDPLWVLQPATPRPPSKGLVSISSLLPPPHPQPGGLQGTVHGGPARQPPVWATLT